MNDFAQHLDTIKQARAETDAALAVFSPTQELAGRALAAAWEAIYDFLCRHKKKIELNELSTAAGIIYKLAQSGHQFKSLEFKTRDYEEKALRFRDLALRTIKETPGLPPELREQLERDFNLIG